MGKAYRDGLLVTATIMAVVLLFTEPAVTNPIEHEHIHEEDCGEPPVLPPCPDPDNPECGPVDPPPEEGEWPEGGQDKNGFTYWRTLEYGDREREELSLWRSDSYNGTAIFIVHGSGWGGTAWANKNTMKDECEHYAKEHDAACITISHPNADPEGGESGTMRPDEQTDYVLKAYEWMHDNVPGITKDYTMGHSSGGHMTILLAARGTIKPDAYVGLDSGGYLITAAYEWLFTAWEDTGFVYRMDNSPTREYNSRDKNHPRNLHVWLDQIWRPSLEWEIDNYIELSGGEKYEDEGPYGHMFHWRQLSDPTTDLHDKVVDFLDLPNPRN